MSQDFTENDRRKLLAIYTFEHSDVNADYGTLSGRHQFLVDVGLWSDSEDLYLSEDDMRMANMSDEGDEDELDA